jgi:succinyl-CoA synthetase beta subunit
MDLYEHQARELFEEHGIVVPRAEVTDSPKEAREIARRLGGRVVVKAQVRTGGRGKAGGVKLAADPAAADQRLVAIRTEPPAEIARVDRARRGAAALQGKTEPRAWTH